MQKRDIYVLGIHDGHNSSAALLKNGKLVGALQEERITRNKNEVGYPRKSIDALLRIEGITPENICKVALSSEFMHNKEHLEKMEYWYKAGMKEQKQRDEDDLREFNEKARFETRTRERRDIIISHLGINEEDIQTVEHHLSHAASAYFGSHYNRDEKVLILTCDGAGDNISATVNIGLNGQIERLSQTSRHDSLGKIYSRVTFLMGMKPWEHEYKIMGLSPYADPNGVERSYRVFDELLGFDESGLNFKKKTELSMNYIYFHLKERLENHRFDWIAGGVQKFTEDILARWVENCIDKTGSGKLALGGGVFMNVKANMKLRQLQKVEDIFVFPSCGDESNAIGAALNVFNENYSEVSPLKNLYLGEEFSNEVIISEIKNFNLEEKCKIAKVENIHEFVGDELAKDKIVARNFGRMEWGARALGNRSILANASNNKNKEIINEMIKMRDFWMPFAPSILFERTEDYLQDWKGEEAKYMIMAYDSTQLATRHLPAAMHPYDKTIRPQLVKKEDNPQYWEVLKSFENKTSIGGILNTSFNLHGYPIVNTPADSIDVFLRSGLENLAIGNYYISKK